LADTLPIPLVIPAPATDLRFHPRSAVLVPKSATADLDGRSPESIPLHVASHRQDNGFRTVARRGFRNGKRENLRQRVPSPCFGTVPAFNRWQTSRPQRGWI